VEQPSLQKLLYDLEVGIPFLFIDQLDVQVPQFTTVNDRGVGRVRVVLGSPGNILLKDAAGSAREVIETSRIRPWRSDQADSSAMPTRNPPWSIPL
jgi:hypothetical protein